MTHAGVTVRPYVDADLDAVLAVWDSAAAVGHPFLSPAFQAEERVLMATRWLPGSETYVAELSGRIVGFVSMGGTEVGGLFVAADHHRRGIGRALLGHALASRDEAELTVFEANERARRFYTALGFEVIERRVGEVEDQPELRMRWRTPNGERGDR